MAGTPDDPSDGDADPDPGSGRAADAVPGFDEPSTSDEFEPVEVFPESEDMDLRSGADNCTKVGSCDAECPVAEVDDEFPGPKFQGPEQWRLTQTGEDYSFDDSVMKCSNCMRCDDACPSGVPFTQMHNTARARHVREQPLSLSKLRNRLLANYRTSAWLASKMPRLSNAVLNAGPVRWVMEKALGIPSEREFPAFATETFREWWERRGGDGGSRTRARNARAERRAGEDGEAATGEAPTDKRVAYFHGCYSNYNTTGVAEATVRVYEQLGYEVIVPEQRCSGTPMFANGRVDDARRHARVNVENLGAAVEDGYDVVCTCTSCSMALRREYPEMFDMEGIAAVAARTYDALEYLRIHEDIEAELADADGDVPDVAYHAPCHARNQGLDRQAVELFSEVEGVEVTDVGDSCSGISGTYGWKTETYETSMEIGAEMFEHMEDAPADRGMTECPTCAMQMEHGTGYEIDHPMEHLETLLVE
jgi:glycerol-3-phosphate dehydrogenase subunit C